MRSAEKERKAGGIQKNNGATMEVTPLSACRVCFTSAHEPPNPGFHFRTAHRAEFRLPHSSSAPRTGPSSASRTPPPHRAPGRVPPSSSASRIQRPWRNCVRPQLPSRRFEQGVIVSPRCERSRSCGGSRHAHCPVASSGAQSVRHAMITILVVDDDDAVRRAMVRLLKNAGFETLEARDGSEAIHHVRAALRRDHGGHPRSRDADDQRRGDAHDAPRVCAATADHRRQCVPRTVRFAGAAAGRAARRRLSAKVLTSPRSN